MTQYIVTCSFSQKKGKGWKRKRGNIPGYITNSKPKDFFKETFYYNTLVGKNIGF